MRQFTATGAVMIAALVGVGINFSFPAANGEGSISGGGRACNTLSTGRLLLFAEPGYQGKTLEVVEGGQIGEEGRWASAIFCAPRNVEVILCERTGCSHDRPVLRLKSQGAEVRLPTFRDARIGWFCDQARYAGNLEDVNEVRWNAACPRRR